MLIKTFLKKIPTIRFIRYAKNLYIDNPIRVFKCKIRIGLYKRKPGYAKIKELYNSKLGEACIIIGNGPSVKFSDLDLIAKSGMDSFGVNRILDVLDKTEWRPTYLSVMDPGFITVEKIRSHTPKEYAKQIVESDVQYAFLTHMLESVLPEIDNVIYLFSPLATMYSTSLMPFSIDSSVYVSDLGNVTSYSIQIAYYLGYRKIYLYGVDGTYPKYLDVDGKFKFRENALAHAEGMKTNLFDELNESVVKTKVGACIEGGYADARKDNKGYNMCRKFAEKNGLQIINLTHGGVIENFERQNFYDVFETGKGEDN